MQVHFSVPNAEGEVTLCYVRAISTGIYPGWGNLFLALLVSFEHVAWMMF